jgi:tRNA threonylcarbamoyladenosine biosynthesis protein TsaB
VSITLGFVLILALDTTTRAGSAAVLRDDRVLREAAGDPAVTHGQRLPADLARLLDEAGVAVADVDLFAVAAGPGSFTGLRVGIATVQGLAMARGRRIVPVSVLDALADAAADGTRRVAAWMDGQRGQVFAALYAADARSVIAQPTALSPEATLASWRQAADLTNAIFAGDGAVRYRDVLAARLGVAIEVVEPTPLAGVIGRIAARDPSRAVLPHAVVPIYVRRSDAELARDRAAEGRI